jgi:endonuclease/exonuclease/phosphatase family metal-dependent hydrolase
MSSHSRRYNDDRIAQAQTLAKLATDPIMDGPCPVIVAGDLNAAPDSVVLRSLRDLLTDAWIAGHGDPTAVTLPSSQPSAPLEAGPELVDQRIDHILLPTWSAGYADHRRVSIARWRPCGRRLPF